jgi:hypothetical protein
MSTNPSPRRRRRPQGAPGDIYHSDEIGGLVRVNDRGEEEPWAPQPYDPEAELHRETRPDPPPELPRRADGTVAPFHSLSEDQLEALGQETARSRRRIRHDGWTLERQIAFIGRLAATASVTDAAHYVGLTRQSARDLYNRSAPFRAAWDEAVKLSVGVLGETAYDRAVNGVQEQVWYKGQMVGYREKHDNRLLMFLLRVRDPLNYAPLDDLQGWQRHRAIEGGSEGLGPTLDRLAAAEKAWSEAETEPPRLPAPADLLDPQLHRPLAQPAREAERLLAEEARGGAAAPPEPPQTASTATSMTSSAQPPASGEPGAQAPCEPCAESAQAGRPAALPTGSTGPAQPPASGEPGAQAPCEPRAESAQAGRPAALPTGSTAPAQLPESREPDEQAPCEPRAESTEAGGPAALPTSSTVTEPVQDLPEDGLGLKTPSTVTSMTSSPQPNASTGAEHSVPSAAAAPTPGAQPPQTPSTAASLTSSPGGREETARAEPIQPGAPAAPAREKRHARRPRQLSHSRRRRSR